MNERVYLFHDLFGTHLRIIRKIGVAERASQVATAEAHKHRRHTRVVPLSLQGIEYLVDTIHNRLKTATLSDRFTERPIHCQTTLLKD